MPNIHMLHLLRDAKKWSTRNRLFPLQSFDSIFSQRQQKDQLDESRLLVLVLAQLQQRYDLRRVYAFDFLRSNIHALTFSQCVALIPILDAAAWWKPSTEVHDDNEYKLPKSLTWQTFVSYPNGERQEIAEYMLETQFYEHDQQQRVPLPDARRPQAALAPAPAPAQAPQQVVFDENNDDDIRKLVYQKNDAQNTYYLTVDLDNKPIYFYLNEHGMNPQAARSMTRRLFRITDDNVFFVTNNTNLGNDQPLPNQDADFHWILSLGDAVRKEKEKNDGRKRMTKIGEHPQRRLKQIQDYFEKQYYVRLQRRELPRQTQANAQESNENVMLDDNRRSLPYNDNDILTKWNQFFPIQPVKSVMYKADAVIQTSNNRTLMIYPSNHPSTLIDVLSNVEMRWHQNMYSKLNVLLSYISYAEIGFAVDVEHVQDGFISQYNVKEIVLGSQRQPSTVSFFYDMFTFPDVDDDKKQQLFEQRERMLRSELQEQEQERNYYREFYHRTNQQIYELEEQLQIQQDSNSSLVAQLHSLHLNYGANVPFNAQTNSSQSAFPQQVPSNSGTATYASKPSAEAPLSEETLKKLWAVWCFNAPSEPEFTKILRLYLKAPPEEDLTQYYEKWTNYKNTQVYSDDDVLEKERIFKFWAKSNFEKRLKNQSMTGKLFKTVSSVLSSFTQSSQPTILFTEDMKNTLFAGVAEQKTVEGRRLAFHTNVVRYYNVLGENIKNSRGLPSKWKLSDANPFGSYKSTSDDFATYLEVNHSDFYNEIYKYCNDDSNDDDESKGVDNPKMTRSQFLEFDLFNKDLWIILCFFADNYTLPDDTKILNYAVQKQGASAWTAAAAAVGTATGAVKGVIGQASGMFGQAMKSAASFVTKPTSAGANPDAAPAAGANPGAAAAAAENPGAAAAAGASATAAASSSAEKLLENIENEIENTVAGSTAGGAVKKLVNGWLQSQPLLQNELQKYDNTKKVMLDWICDQQYITNHKKNSQWCKKFLTNIDKPQLKAWIYILSGNQWPADLVPS